MMLDRLSEISKRIMQIKTTFTKVNNFKPEAVKDFETMYKESISKYNKIKSDTAKKTEPNPIKNTEIQSDTNIDSQTNSANDPIQDAVIKASKRYKISSDLINAVIQTESGFNPNSISKAGAMGLMQLMPSTSLQLGVKKPFDIEQNIDGGTRYLQSLLRRYGGDLDKALAAYNAGPARVDAIDGVPDIPETKKYVYKIKKLLK